MSDKAHILVVDDEVTVRAMLEVVLSAEGYRVSTVDSGEQCLALSQVEAFDLIVLDLYMGGIDGFEVLRRLHEDPDARNVPVIFLSAATEVEQRTQGLTLGAVDFITKPFYNAELLARVRTHLELQRLRYSLQQQASNLQSANDSLQREITHRQKAEDEIRSKSRELERFTYTVSHDLRSPLVTIRTFLPHLVDDLAQNNTEYATQDLALINTAAEKMHALLEELLLLSRAGRGVQVPELIPLQDVITDALALVAGRIDRRGVKVNFTGSELMVRGERARLLQVFQNLVDNAVKFMGDQPAPRIEITAQEQSEEIHIAVRDNGIGIDPQHVERLFDVFEKVDRNTEGAGMGLALVKRIVEAHGGRVWVESDGPGKGSCFQVALPQEQVQGLEKTFKV